MLKIILLVIVAVIVIILIVAAMQPDDYRYERSAKINAPASAIMPWIDSPKKVAEWSPWIEMDPAATYTYSGPDKGVGASTSWEGHKSGAGTATVIEVVPNERVVTKLEFKKPMEGLSTAEMILEPVDGGTNVTWTMSGKNNFIGKAVGLLMNCEKMMNETYDKGLQNLKAKVEGQ